MSADDPGERREFTRREIDIAEGLAAQASVAIENARLLDSAQTHSLLDRTLAEATASLASSLEVEAAIPEVLSAVARALGALGATVDRRDRGGWRNLATGAAAAHTEFGAQAPADVLTRVFETREPVFVVDVGHQSSEVADAPGSGEYGSSASYPVLYRDQVTAVVTLFFEESGRSLSDGERFFTSRLAFVLGVTQENARLYHAQRNVADHLQEALLTLPDRVAGVDFATYYQAAAQEARVGGDFFDLFDVDDRRVAFVVGDVSGKGLTAASLTALAKSALRAHLMEDADPGSVLTKTGRLIHRFTSAETFLTVFLGILDVHTGELRFSNAGHPPAVIGSADGARLVEGVNPVLGAFDGVRYTTHVLTLGAREPLLLYTDGIIEARRDGELFGEERLLAVMDEAAELDLDKVLALVMSDTLAFTNHHLRDDVALLVLRRTVGDAGEPGRSDQPD
jgi:GAF domain-containing protein